MFKVQKVGVTLGALIHRRTSDYCPYLHRCDLLYDALRFLFSGDTLFIVLQGTAEVMEDDVPTSHTVQLKEVFCKYLWALNKSIVVSSGFHLELPPDLCFPL